MSIPISKNGNIEPHLISCSQCNGEVNGLTVGVMYKSEYKGQTIYADRDHRSKTNREVGEKLDWIHVEEGERVVMGLCDTCQEALDKERTEHKAEVALGGVYFQCASCSATGVIKAGTVLAGAVRDSTGIHVPDPVGVEFASCEEHTYAE